MLLDKLDNYIRKLLVEKVVINYTAIKNGGKITDELRQKMLLACCTIDNLVDDTKVVHTFKQYDFKAVMMYEMTYYVPKFKANKFKTNLALALTSMNYNWRCIDTNYYVSF